MADQRRGLSHNEATPVVRDKPKSTAKPGGNQPPQRPWWWYVTPAGIANEAEYRRKQMQRVNKGYTRVGNMGVLPLYRGPNGQLTTSIPTQRDVVLGAAKVPGNVVNLGVNLAQRATNGWKPADPKATSVGRAVESAQRGLTSVMQMPQVEQRQPEDLFWQDMGEQFTAGALGGAVAGGLVKATAFTNGAFANMAPWAQRALRWTAGVGTESFVATPLTNNLNGNVANAFGDKAPLAVQPTDDPLSATFKSLLPNAGAEIFTAGLFLGGTEGLGAVGRRLRQGRDVSEVSQARQWTVDNGLQVDADGKYDFPQQPAKPEPAPEPVAAPAPEPAAAPAPTTRAEAEAQLLGTEEPAAAPEAAPIPTQEMAPGGAVTEGKLPEADPDLDPWYDPALPEVDTAVRAVQRLDDEQLTAAATGAGPVLPDLDARLTNQQATFQPQEGLTPDLVAAPAGRLATPMVPYEAQWQQLPNNTLISLASPANNPELFAQVRQLTGRDFEQFTRQDVLEGLGGLQAAGTTVIPNRAINGAQLFRTDDIGVDPARFQFKDNVNAEGQQKGNSLEGVDRWNTDAEGAIQVWNDPADGVTYVVNGHNRVAKAKELGIPSLRGEELLAQTPEQARAQGAISNIASGGGTPFDAAKVIRELGIQDAAGLEAVGIPLQSGLGTQGLALSKLPDNLFQQAVNGELPMGRALALGGSGLDPADMIRVAQLGVQRNVSERGFAELVQMASSAPKVADSSQGGIPGMDEWLQDSSVLEKAELSAKVRAELISNKNLFGKVGKNKAAQKLADKGATQVNQEQVLTAADVARGVLDEFDRDKYLAGTPISELLNQGAAEIAAGAKPAVVMKRIMQQLEAAAEQAPPAPLAKPEAAVEEPVVEPAGLMPEQRVELQKQVVQRAIENGEVRPSETPIPELPEGPRNLSDPIQTLEDEVRLAGEYGMADAIHAQAELDAKRLQMGWDSMTLDEKKANGLMDGWDTRDDISAEETWPEGWQVIDANPRATRNLTTEDVRARQALTEAATEVVERVTGWGNLSVADEQIWEVIPPEHGGDGVRTGLVNGYYNQWTDLVHVAGLMQRPAERIIETAYHESWHRIQYTLLTQKDMEVFDSVFGKARVSDYAGLRGARGKASMERQAYAFQAYAGAREQGFAPASEEIRMQVVDMLDNQFPRKSGESWGGTLRGEAAVRIFQGFDRLMDFVERINNAVRGRGFESVESLYEKAFRGELAHSRALDYAAKQATPDQKARLAKIAEWKGDNKKAVYEVSQMIAGIDEQINALKAQAISGGC